ASLVFALSPLPPPPTSPLFPYTTLFRSDQLGVADFHAEIAARDHYAIARTDQAVECLVIGYRFGSFDLRNQPGAGAGFVAQTAGQLHVQIGRASWREREKVEAVRGIVNSMSCGG